MEVFIIACLHEGFKYVKVLVLNNTIGLGVIWRNIDMMDAIFLRQVSSCSHKCGAIVSNNFGHSTPSAKDIFEYKIPKGLLIFFPKRAPLGPR